MRNSAGRVRRRLSYEAARIMVEEGTRDYKRAKQKACLRIGVPTNQSVPSNLEVEDSVAEHLQIFFSDAAVDLKWQYLRIAFEMMQKLKRYSPRLVGATLSGNITSARPIELQVFADTVEEIRFLLEDAEIPCRMMQKRLRYSRVGFCHITGFEVDFEETFMEILVFLPADPYPPLGAVNGKPQARFAMKKVKRLLESRQGDSIAKGGASAAQ